MNFFSSVQYSAHVLCWPRKAENYVQENRKELSDGIKHSICSQSIPHVCTQLNNIASSTAFIPHKMIVCICKLFTWTSN